MGRIIKVNVRKGGAAAIDMVVGSVEVTPTKLLESGIYTILPAPVTVGLSSGMAELDLIPSPQGDDPAWAYRVTIRDEITGVSVSEYVGVPAGDEPLAYTALPRYRGSVASLPALVPIETRGDLPDGADVFTYTTAAHVGAWRIVPGRTYYNLPVTSAQSGVLEVIKGGPSVTLRASYFDQKWWVEAPLGVWGAWNKFTSMGDLPTASPSEAILALARADGWAAVYDPTNPATRQVNANTGNIQRISDGLGNLPDAVAGTNPVTVPNAFGQLWGFRERSLKVTFAEPVEQPITYMAVAQTDEAYNSKTRWLIGGDTAGGQHRVYLTPNTSRLVIADNTSTMSSEGAVITNRPVVISASFNNGRGSTSVNGQFGLTSTNGQTGGPVKDIRFGVRSAGVLDYWQGAIGPVLIYQGEVPQEKLARMSNLLMLLAGIQRDQPTITEGARVFSMDAQGNEEFVQGDPDAILTNGILSMTKMINALAARKFLTTDALLDQVVTLGDGDFNSAFASVFKDGDQVTYRDILHAMALPSDNSAPVALANQIGKAYTSGDKSPRQRYVDVMNQILAQDLGFKGAAVMYEGGTAFLSPRQVAGVLKKLSEDPVLRGIFGKLSYTVTITGPNARTFEIKSTLDNPNWPVLGYQCGKSGTGSGNYHAATMWRDPKGNDHYTVAMDIPYGESVNARYRDIRVARDLILSGVKHINREAHASTGSPVQTTLLRNISKLVTGGSTGVYLQRIGTTVEINFQGVVLTESKWAGLLPDGWRPALTWAYGQLRNADGTVDVSVSKGSGTLEILDPITSAPYRGTIRFEVSPSAAWPVPPYPGEYSNN